MDKIRELRADEIEVRVGQVTEKGVSLLLYKDARCDKRILDETFGINGWANVYSEIKGNLYCSIMLYDEKTGMWIQKQDCGVESNTEKEKGEASDAFKRAGFNVGIGRELYTKIFIFVHTPTKLKSTLNNGKKVYELEDQYAKWHVAKIQTNMEKEKIEFLQIADKNNNIVFTYGKEKPEPKTTQQKPVEPKKVEKEQPKLISVEQQKQLFKLADNNNELVRNVITRYKYEKTNQIKESDYEQICKEIESENLM